MYPANGNDPSHENTIPCIFVLCTTNVYTNEHIVIDNPLRIIFKYTTQSCCISVCYRLARDKYKYNAYFIDRSR